MPTASEVAAAEATVWSEVAARWTEQAAPELWADRPPTEKTVIVYWDPRDDLRRRSGEWSVSADQGDLASLASFASLLASTEASAWASDTPDLATRAYETRRLLLSDRVIHWAVPWLDAVGRCYPANRDTAHAHRDGLLRIGDEMRVAPALTGSEGLLPPGEDSFGSTRHREGWHDSLWSGALILQATRRSMANAGDDYLELLYEAASARWRGMARRHPGSAQLWNDLADRAGRTAVSVQSRQHVGHA